MSLVEYIWPVSVQPEFAWGRYPSGGYHPAYDFGVPTGTNVHAPASGTIVVAGMDDTGYGLHLRIRHATGHMSILAHNSTLLVSVGQHVEQGGLVSISGATGKVTGPHVHWETRTSVTGLQRDTAYDPGPYVGAGLPFKDQLPQGGDIGGPVMPSPAWYGTTPGLVIPPAAETITGNPVGPAVARFSPVRIAA